MNVSLKTSDRIAFQFHKGAIRTYDQQLEEDEETHFNSIKVRLEQYLYNDTDNNIHNFNSIKVRLEQDLQQRAASTNMISIP